MENVLVTETNLREIYSWLNLFFSFGREETIFTFKRAATGHQTLFYEFLYPEISLQKKVTTITGCRISNRLVVKLDAMASPITIEPGNRVTLDSTTLIIKGAREFFLKGEVTYGFRKEKTTHESEKMQIALEKRLTRIMQAAELETYYENEYWKEREEEEKRRMQECCIE